ncbi:Protein of uncharacterised function (DUF968) [Yersinia frederiksenii]|uniref:Protein of uncharacterized function (DUF968) n=1 Tax=Yersinia frederiksenii TaxID=29484 RepID=A0A380PUW5_YERFR|nr:DUF968 domain-containing protein [Yersinia frederiksenii]SUP77338.1 Protein of uncharacterised function (DUF968) [Yersinia frederiksenii]
MRALLTPFIQQELGVVILKPGAELLPYLSGRLLVATEPEEFKSLPAGLLPVTDQLLANDPRLLPFFEHERVLSAAGGPRVLEAWVKQLKECQWHSPDDTHDRNLTILRYGQRSICLCWHHDNKLREHTTARLNTLATNNLITWLISTVCDYFRFPDGHQLTMPELCYWAVVNEVYDLLPDSIARASLRMLPEEIKSGPTRECDITWTPAPTKIIETKVELVKKVLALKIDDEPPASFMRIPKRYRWESRKWLTWVKSQACSGCGGSADDAHHIIGHGQGGMGTKAHDLFSIPLCRGCHDALHADMHTWEAEYGSQIVLWFHFMDRSISIGAMA